MKIVLSKLKPEHSSQIYLSWLKDTKKSMYIEFRFRNHFLNKIHKLKNLYNKQILVAKKTLYFLDTLNYKNHLNKSKILNFDNFYKSYNKGLLKNKFVCRQKILIKNSFKNLKKIKLQIMYILYPQKITWTII
tara:strand:+ start:507 stop:905 length:399 start_codon:yes stop_codon:yes gene_type:complete